MSDLEAMFESLSEAHAIQADGLGWGDVDPDTGVARASKHAGAAHAFDTAARLTHDHDDDVVPLHEFETVDTEKLLRHPDRMLYDLEASTEHRDVFEKSPIVEDIDVVDDQTMKVTMIVDLPDEL
jgi:hypothetical protein